ncbi:MAG: carbon-nitrogen hydrolase [Alphaproteobacteria bacterium]|nr:MAG: carbon-nitrogen hydrolase [Alphaproteobacteria bacterium]
MTLSNGSGSKDTGRGKDMRRSIRHPAAAGKGRRRFFRLTILLFGMLGAAILALARIPVPHDPPDLRLKAIRIFGPAPGAADRAQNPVTLIGISPWMAAADYRSAAAFEAKVEGYLEAAEAQGLMGPRSIVVLPEYFGTWLVAMDAPGQTFRAPSTGLAMLPLIFAQPRAFRSALARSHERDRIAAAIFRMRSPAMAAAWQDVFSRLARRHQVTIVAGSIVLEDPVVREGRLVTRPGQLYNVSGVFHADGRLDPALVRKVYPIPSETPFLAAAASEELPVFETGFGRLGVLICADSWYPDTFARLKAQGAEWIAVPSFLQPDGAWDRPWGGYLTKLPPDVDGSAAGSITEGEAWLRFALAGRFPASGAVAGINVFLKGELWGLGADGRTTAVIGASGIAVSPVADGADILAVRVATAQP